MRSSARLLTTLLLCAFPLPSYGQSWLAIASKVEEAQDRVRARQALGELETDARGAQEYYALKRRVPGTRDVPVERYAVAAQEAKRLPLRSTSQRTPSQKSNLDVGSASGITDWVTSSLVSGLDTWQPLGPYNVPGRSRALVFAPSNPNVMYTAGVAGGVWKSTDNGESWTSVGDAMGNIAVTSLAMDPTNSNVIYAGTGEGFGNFDAVRGLGVFKSTDGGANWIASTTYMSYVNDIVVSSQNSNIVFAATNDGIYRSTDGGLSFLVIYSGRFTDLAMRSDADVLFAANDNLSGSRIFRAVNASSISPTFELVLPPTQYNPQWGRISLAIAPSNQNVVYALIASIESSRDGSLEAVYRSNNGGAAGSWVATVDYSSPVKLNRLLLSNVLAANATLCGAGPDFLYGQGWYDNVITVDPTNPERVWAGGTDLFRSDDGGKNWKLASYWWADDNDPSYAHADHHAIVFDPQYNGTTNRQIWVTNDGGVFRSNEALAATSTNPCSPSASGFQWQRKSAGIATTQFYGGAVYADGLSYFGGTQDNGTVKGSDAAGVNAWQEMLGGDGGKAAIDPTNPAIMYAEHPYLDIQRSMDGGITWTPITRTLKDYGFFVTPFALDPSQPQRLWTGGIYLWRSDDRGTNWQRAGVVTPGEGYLSAIAVSPVNPNNVVAGLSDGYLLVTNTGLSANANTQWPYVKPRNGFVSSITFDPIDAKTVYVTYSSFNQFPNSAHIYKSIDLGATWQPLDGAGDYKIPDIPVNSLVVDPFVPTHLYIGTDIGVFVSLDGGLNWNRENTGFGNVVAESLVVNRNGSIANLFAFTHGRGVYRTTLRDLGIVVSPTALDFKTFPVGLATPPLTVTVRNPGQVAIDITGAQVTTNFAIASNSCGTLNGGDSCTITVTMMPPSVGKFSGNLAISHTGSNSPYNVTLQGEGINGAFIQVDKTELEFGNVESQVASAVQVVTLTNIGSAVPFDVNYLVHQVDQHYWPNPPFSAIDDCSRGAVLSPGKSCRIYIRVFENGGTGHLNHSVDIGVRSISAPDQAISVHLTGDVYPSRMYVGSSPDGISYPAGSGPTDWALSASGITPSTRVTVNGVLHPFRFLYDYLNNPFALSITLSTAELSKPGVLYINVDNGFGASRTFRAFVYAPKGVNRGVWDPYTQQIYGLTDNPTVFGGPRKLQKLDPRTGQITDIMDVDSHYLAPVDAATDVTISDDGKYLYFALGGYVERFNLRTQIIEKLFTVAARDTNWVQSCPATLFPLKGHSLDLLVYKSCGTADPYALSVFSDGVKAGSSYFSGGYRFKYKPGTDDIYNLGGFGLEVLHADSINGVSNVQQFSFNANYSDFALDQNQLFSDFGVFNATTMESIGVLTARNFNQPPLFARAVFLNPSTKVLVRAGSGYQTFDTETHDETDLVNLPTPFGGAFGLWNSGHNLFITTTDKTFLFRIPADVAPANEPSPSLSGLSQAYVTQGSDNLLLILIGDNFSPWTQAKWNGADRETEFVDAKTLKIYIPWTDLQTAGQNQITVANAQGQQSAAVAFAVIAPLSTVQSALQVLDFGDGTGSVSGSANSIDCGSDCLAILPENTVVTLTAVPAIGSAFVGWGGECSGVADCIVTTSGIKSVTATFQATQQLLELEKKGSGHGTVSANAGNLDCGNTCSAYIGVATTVKVLAVAAPGSRFMGWTDACKGTGSCEVTMKTAQKVAAIFRGADQTLLRSDLDGDGKADITVWRPSSGTWFTIRSQNHSNNSQQWGAVINGVQDIPVPGDYDGDGKMDIAVWRPSEGMWYIRPSSAPATVITQQWGATISGVQDIPVPADYDGDGKTDIAVWRPTDGTWYVRPSSIPGTYITQQWGAVVNGVQDIPVVGDYDGDAKADIAIWRPSNGTWYIRPSGKPGLSLVQQWGATIGGVADRPVAADYDGDGKSDIAVWRPSEGKWYVLPSSAPGTYISQQWGAVIGGVEDVPVPADYDGDGKADYAVWRPGNGTWYTLPSATVGSHTETQWGTTGDIPTQRQK